MKKILTLAAIAAPALLLAGCGSTEPADAPAEADNVEMPAAEVMEQPGMEQDTAEPMADDTAAAEEAPVEDTTAADAAADADDAAADLSAAMDN